MSGFRTTNFDAVAASAPLNREASTVRDGSGDLWEAKAPPPHIRHYKAPVLGPNKRPALVPDMTGKVFGRLTVTHYHGKPEGSGKNAKAVWLVRCACGDYEVRTTQAIERALTGVRHGDDGMDHACVSCLQVQYLQLKARGRSTKARRKADADLLDRFASGGRV